MPKTLVLRLAGDADVAAALLGLNEDGADICSVAEAAAAWRRLRRYRRIGVVGEPPEDEIGFGIVPFLALASRAERIVSVDTRLRAAGDRARGRFLGRTLLTGGAQLVCSGAAVVVQRVLLEALLRAGPPVVQKRSPELRRVLYLRPHTGTGAGVGGSVTHTHAVIRALRAEGVDVDSWTSDAAIAETAATEPVRPCDWRILRASRLLKAIPASAALGVDAAAVGRLLGPARAADAIYQRHQRFSLSGALLSRLTGTPLFLEYNGSEVYANSVWGQRVPLMRQLADCERAVLRSAAAIIVVAEASRDELVARGIEAERILINPNGVDANRFAPGGGTSERRTLGLEAAEVIGFVGSFGPWHGAPVLASAFVQLAAKRPTARLLLVGDGPERERVLAILREGGVRDRVVLTGKVPPSRVPALLDACDVLASPHVDLGGGVEFFGSPTKLFEYMASGRPIVASRLGQIGEVLEQQVSAILVPPGDDKELAAALERVLEDASLGDQLGREARRIAIQRHSWRTNAQRVVQRYGGLERVAE